MSPLPALNQQLHASVHSKRRPATNHVVLSIGYTWESRDGARFRLAGGEWLRLVARCVSNRPAADISLIPAPRAARRIIPAYPPVMAECIRVNYCANWRWARVGRALPPGGDGREGVAPAEDALIECRWPVRLHCDYGWLKRRRWRWRRRWWWLRHTVSAQICLITVGRGCRGVRDGG